MRAIWSGSISFGLVNIPVKMYSASRERELKYVMLHKKDLSEIRFARICKVEEKEVPWEEIVKGFKDENGEFVVLEEEDFKRAALQRSKTIEIINFVKESEIDTVYYNKPYFLEPDKNAANAYALLLEALRQAKKVGIAKFIFHNREHLAVIKAYENVIVLNELRYDSELNNAKEIEVPAHEKATPQAISIALKLIDHLTTPFKPGKYTDTYVEEMKGIIEKKGKGKKVHVKGHEVAAKPSKIHDIMSLLKESLEEAPPKKVKKAS